MVSIPDIRSSAGSPDIHLSTNTPVFCPSAYMQDLNQPILLINIFLLTLQMVIQRIPVPLAFHEFSSCSTYRNPKKSSIWYSDLTPSAECVHRLYWFHHWGPQSCLFHWGPLVYSVLPWFPALLALPWLLVLPVNIHLPVKKKKQKNIFGVFILLNNWHIEQNSKSFGVLQQCHSPNILKNVTRKT